MDKSKVYFAKLDEFEKIKTLFPKFESSLGVKVHFGERGNTTFLPAKYTKELIKDLDKPTLIETSVLYRSPRSQAKTHLEVALEHGFDFAPIDFLDGELGDDTVEIEIDSKHFKKCYLGKNITKYNSLLVISHFKGHGAAIFGATMKNLGMGLAARRGKLAQHASIKHTVDKEKCVSCGQCIAECPVEAISFGSDRKIKIDKEKCISCSKCISTCPVKAIEIPWTSTGTDVLQERIVEYARAGIQDKQCFYVNFVMNITAECDCKGHEMDKIAEDIGVLASNDPLALDQASCDLLIEKNPHLEIIKLGEAQLRHAEELGLGNREYELINL